MSDEKITKDMGIMDIVQKHPDTIEVFMKSGMHCIGCAAAHFETLEQGCEAHGIDVDKLVEELNKKISETSAEDVGSDKD